MAQSTADTPLSRGTDAMLAGLVTPMATPLPGVEQQWELSKENFVPLKSGRRTLALQEVAADPVDSASKHALEMKRRELLQEIKECSTGDPIEPWQRYIKWTQEHMAGGGGIKAEMTRVLEACTRELVKHDKYFKDIRFLRIWVQYADCLPDPGDVFIHLREQGIGLDFALFYEAHATYYELKGNCASADMTYTEGINKRAQPLERLKKKYVAFQNRMAQRIQRSIAESTPTVSTAAAPCRTSLAPIGYPGGGAAHMAQQRGQPSRQQPGAVGTAAPGGGRSLATSLAGMFNPRPGARAGPSGASAAAVASGLRSANGGASLVLDDLKESRANGSSWGAGGGGGGNSGAAGGPGSSGAVGGLYGAGGSGSGGAAMGLYGGGGATTLTAAAAAPRPGFGSSAELKPYTVIRKENMDKPTMWAGQTMASQPSAGVPPPAYPPTSAAPLKIYTDEEFQEGDAPAAQPPPPPPSFRRTLEAVPVPPATSAPYASSTSALQPVLPTGRAAGCAPTSLPAHLHSSSSLSQTASSALAQPHGGVLEQQAALVPSSSVSMPSGQGAPAAAPRLSAAAGPPSARSSALHHVKLASSLRRQAAAGLLPVPTHEGFDAKLLIGPSGEEVSFEEVRGALWRQRRAFAAASSAAKAVTATAAAGPSSDMPAPAGELASATPTPQAEAPGASCSNIATVMPARDPAVPRPTQPPLTQSSTASAEAQGVPPQAARTSSSTGRVNVDPCQQQADPSKPFQAWAPQAASTSSRGPATNTEPVASTCSVANPATPRLAHPATHPMPAVSSNSTGCDFPQASMRANSTTSHDGGEAPLPRRVLQETINTCGDLPPTHLTIAAAITANATASSSSSGTSSRPVLQDTTSARGGAPPPPPLANVSTSDSALGGVGGASSRPVLPANPAATGSAAVAPAEPTVTLSTQGAFDMLNSMFCDELPPHQSLRPAADPSKQKPTPFAERAAPPLAPTTAQHPVPPALQQPLPPPLSSCSAPSIPAAAATSKPEPFAERAAPWIANTTIQHLVPPALQQPLPSAPLSSRALPPPAVAVMAVAPLRHEHVPPAASRLPVASAPRSEPTVTLSTQAAFDIMNDLFSDTLPHEAVRRQRPTAALPSDNSLRPLRPSDVCRLANTAKLPPAPPALRPPLPLASQAPPTAFVYEDTDFVGARSLASHLLLSHPPAVPHQQSHPGRDGDCGPASASGAAVAVSCGGLLYEDTEFVMARPQPYSAADTGGGGGVGGSTSSGGVYEDTEFVIPRPQGFVANSNSCGGGSGGASIGIYEDTEFVGTRQGTLQAVQTGAAAVRSAGIYEDTDFVLPVRRQAAGLPPVPPAVPHLLGSSVVPLMTAGPANLSSRFESMSVGTSGGLASSRGLVDGGGSLASKGFVASGMYEDTEFVRVPPVAASRPQSPPQAASGPSTLGGSGSSNRTGQRDAGSSINSSSLNKVATVGGMAMYEDTEFVAPRMAAAMSGGRSVAADAGKPTRAMPGGGMYEDTECYGVPVPGAWQPNMGLLAPEAPLLPSAAVNAPARPPVAPLAKGQPAVAMAAAQGQAHLCATHGDKEN